MSDQSLSLPNEEFSNRALRAFRELFSLARDRNELQFAFALSPEFRGAQDPGWNTAHEAHRAFEDYMGFIHGEKRPGIRARVALGFYCHLSEASGFYEIPKNLLRICDGERYGIWPFAHLVSRHKLTGQKIAPNSKRSSPIWLVMQRKSASTNLPSCFEMLLMAIYETPMRMQTM